MKQKNVSKQEIEIVFLTTNERKFAEMKELVPDYIVLTREEPEFNEIQGKPEEVIIDKIKKAYEQVKKPVIVDDTNLTFGAWGYLPGVYINDFMQTVDRDGLVKMLDRFDDKTAVASAYIGYHDGEEPRVFKGEIHGKIVEPRGIVSFGWDPIFEPEGFSETFAEMGTEGKNKISHRNLALKQLVEYLE